MGLYIIPKISANSLLNVFWLLLGNPISIFNSLSPFTNNVFFYFFRFPPVPDRGVQSRYWVLSSYWVLVLTRYWVFSLDLTQSPPISNIRLNTQFIFFKFEVLSPVLGKKSILEPIKDPIWMPGRDPWYRTVDRLNYFESMIPQTIFDKSCVAQFTVRNWHFPPGSCDNPLELIINW